MDNSRTVLLFVFAALFVMLIVVLYVVVYVLYDVQLSDGKIAVLF